MPVPLLNREVENAITSALEKSGAIAPQAEVRQALIENGMDINRLACELSNLICNAKDNTKLQAILKAFACHGINIDANADPSRSINIQFNVVSENVNLNNLFAPERS